MKSAVIAAIVAALVSSGATLAATRINGQAIAKHTIPANRLTPAAVTEFSTAATPTPRATAAAVNSTIDYEATTQHVVAGDTVTAMCPANYVALSGGFQWAPGGDGPVVQSGHLPNGSGWQIVIGPETGGTATITVSVTCEPNA